MDNVFSPNYNNQKNINKTTFCFGPSATTNLLYQPSSFFFRRRAHVQSQQRARMDMSIGARFNGCMQKKSKSRLRRLPATHDEQRRAQRHEQVYKMNPAPLTHRLYAENHKIVTRVADQLEIKTLQPPLPRENKKPSKAKNKKRYQATPTGIANSLFSCITFFVPPPRVNTI